MWWANGLYQKLSFHLLTCVQFSIENHFCSTGKLMLDAFRAIVVVIAYLFCLTSSSHLIGIWWTVSQYQYSNAALRAHRHLLIHLSISGRRFYVYFFLFIIVAMMLLFVENHMNGKNGVCQFGNQHCNAYQMPFHDDDDNNNSNLLIKTNRLWIRILFKLSIVMRAFGNCYTHIIHTQKKMF